MQPTTGPGTILVVDDVPDNIRILNEMLKGYHRVIFATHGEAALDLAVRERPDLILLDVMMPEMDGYAVCRQLKDRAETRDIPVIFITALTRMEDEVRGLDSGAVDYITKPFHPEVVLLRANLHIELKRHRDFLARLSCVDGLTGVANRKNLDETLACEWRRAIRAGDPLSIVMVDIDRFKLFNDTYGHLAGDKCLIQVAQALDECLHRSGDLIARYGGEEFCAVLVGCNREGAVKVAEQMCATVEGIGIEHTGNTPFGKVTISAGVGSRQPGEDDDLSAFRERVDRALYAAKSTGRNRVIAMESS